MPRDRAIDDGHGGYKLKRKKARIGTGNGPTRYKCHRSECGHAWNPEPDAINAAEGWAQCVCWAKVRPEA